MLSLKEVIMDIYDPVLLEKLSAYKIYVDLDGVLCDFNAGFYNISGGIDRNGFIYKYGKEAAWKLINQHGTHWWATLPWKSDGKRLWSFLNNIGPIFILSSCSEGQTSGTAREGKLSWVLNNLGKSVVSRTIIVNNAVEKQKYGNANSILIDDTPINIAQWKSKGGIGILHKTAEQTIEQIKALI